MFYPLSPILLLHCSLSTHVHTKEARGSLLNGKERRATGGEAIWSFPTQEGSLRHLIINLYWTFSNYWTETIFLFVNKDYQNFRLPINNQKCHETYPRCYLSCWKIKQLLKVGNWIKVLSDYCHHSCLFHRTVTIIIWNALPWGKVIHKQTSWLGSAVSGISALHCDNGPAGWVARDSK